LPGSNSQFDPQRRVVAGLLPAARLAVDSGRAERFGEAGAEQRMVDADPGVTLERVPPIVPEGIDALVGEEVPQGVGSALRNELSIFLARLGR
jgi:hypothetical protein